MGVSIIICLAWWATVKRANWQVYCQLLVWIHDTVVTNTSTLSRLVSCCMTIFVLRTSWAVTIPDQFSFQIYNNNKIIIIIIIIIIPTLLMISRFRPVKDRPLKAYVFTHSAWLQWQARCLSRVTFYLIMQNLAVRLVNKILWYPGCPPY